MDSVFWLNVLSNFLADLCFSAIVAGIGSCIWKRMRKVDVKILARVHQLGDQKQRILFCVKNTGRVKFDSNELYWNVYVDASAYTLIDAGTTSPRKIYMDDHEFSLFCGQNRDQPIFYEAPPLELFSIEVNVEKVENPHPFYYHLTTAHGMFPKKIKVDSRGFIPHDVLGKVEIQNN